MLVFVNKYLYLLKQLQLQVEHANDQGYVTSVCFSPDVGTMIGLGFVKNGPARMGERMVVRDHVRDLTVEVEICSPVFVDPEGGRVRG